MVMLRAFRPLRYNAAVVGDISTVVAPPYDVINDTHRDALYARSPHNVIRLILNRASDRYGAAAERLHAWRREQALVRDTTAAVVFYVENFTLPDGRSCEREGIISAVRLEDFASGRIRPHERTFARAKEDRLRVLRACRTNLSPIFGLFADREAALNPARVAAGRTAPDMDLRDDANVRHRVWLLKDPQVIAALRDGLRDETVFIADGHHRYETALAYRDELRAQGRTDPEAPHNFILMYLTSMSHPGLVILPTHRILSKLPAGDGTVVFREVERYFDVRRFPRSAHAAFLSYLRQEPQRGRFGIALSDTEELCVAMLRDPAVLDRQAADRAPVVRRLDVSILDALILRGLLHVDCTLTAQAGGLTYTHDDAEALRAVEQGAAAAFLMNAPRIEDVQAVCLAGETMPEKSTYFYPKLLTGLVFHPLDDEAADGSSQTATSRTIAAV